MLDDLGLVHMNARLYDPLFGVFLSPDSVTQFAGSTQGWNRYSYVGQNPLSFVDPSGHKKWGTIFRVVVAIVAVVAIVMTAGAALGVAGAAISGLTGGFITAAVATAAVQAAVTTFVFTAIVSGSLRVAAKAALIAGVCGGLANAAGGGALGGALEGTSRAALQGGDIKQGFITGVVPIASYYYAYKGKGTDGIAMLLGQKILADIASGAFELSPSPSERELMPSWEEIEATDEASWRYPRPRLQGRGDFAPQSLAESASSGRGGQDGPVGERLERLAVGARAAASSPASRDLGDYDPRPPVFSPTEALTNIAACAAVGVAAAQAGALIGGLGGPLSSAIWAFGFRFSATNLCTDASPSRDTGGYNLSDLGAP
ncbi:MAG: RHS repeat-associated core domain-containing protein [Myxococcales bacterium]|nr:RHS repeat-associated core domain-containing protein [Myxococcales bacterium]